LPGAEDFHPLVPGSLHFLRKSGDKRFGKPGENSRLRTHSHQRPCRIKSGIAVPDNGHSFAKVVDFIPIQAGQKGDAAFDSVELLPWNSQFAVSPGTGSDNDSGKALLEVFQPRGKIDGGIGQDMNSQLPDDPDFFIQNVPRKAVWADPITEHASCPGFLFEDRRCISKTCQISGRGKSSRS